jgi:hypothetical protein
MNRFVDYKLNRLSELTKYVTLVNRQREELKLKITVENGK